MKTWFKDLLVPGKQCIGTFAMLPSADSCEILAKAGFEFITVDLEHRPTSAETMLHMLRAIESADTASVVRVRGLREDEVKVALSCGATAIWFPGIQTAAEARTAVSLCKHPPMGVMGMCPFDRAFDFGINGVKTFSELDYIKVANEKRAVIVAIEDNEGLKNLPEIVKIPGVDVIDIGMCDLATDMGYHGDLEHPAVVKRVKETMDLIHSAGKYIMLGTPREESMGYWIQQGCDVSIYCTDISILAMEGMRLYNEIQKYVHK